MFLTISKKPDVDADGFRKKLFIFPRIVKSDKETSIVFCESVMIRKTSLSSKSYVKFISRSNNGKFWTTDEYDTGAILFFSLVFVIFLAFCIPLFIIHP